MPCPGNCEGVIPVRLPAPSALATEIVASLFPNRAPREAEVEYVDEFPCWSEVAAAADLCVGEQVVVGFGTPGVLLGRATLPGRVVVQFDKRVDLLPFAVQVYPTEIVRQLPPACPVRIGERAMASLALHSTSG